MKKIFYTLVLFLFSSTLVYADNIYSIDMDIYIDEEGVASITETWNVKASEGTEWYKSMYDLNNSRVYDYTVTMDGKQLTKKIWDTSETLSQKAGYYGINYTSSGIELCFGKSDMNYHTFVLNYKVSDYVFNTSDSQTLYWTLLPNVTLDDFSVTVKSYYSFPDTLEVWGYGYKGYAYVENGMIKMSNKGSLNSEYVVLLVKFPLDTFKTNNTSNYETFDEVLSRAEEGSFKYDYGNSSFSIIQFLIDIIHVFLMPGIFIFGILKTIDISNYGYKNNKKIDKKNTPLFREIPCNKDIYYANTLIKLNNFNYKKTNVLGAIILKWVKEKKVVFKKDESSKKEKNVIELLKESNFDNSFEKELFDMMYEASGDGILETKEFEKWAKKNYSKFLGLFDRINNSKVSKLKSEGHIYKRTSKKECKERNVMDDTIYEDSKELYGLKLFLQEFSRMKEKEVLDVHLWDEYLMFAYLFGIADKVAKQLKNLYPELIEQYNDFDLDTILYISNISIRTANVATSAAEAAAASYSSGGGGFSSGGGGGGSSGGGGGMGGR